MKKTWKRLCTGFLALATVVTALPTIPVHAESKQYWTESAERVGIIEKVMNDGSIGSTFNEGYMKVEDETAYCIDINTDFKNGYKTRADASSRMSADQISDVALSLEYVKQYGKAYCYALKKACKSMNDEIGKITEEKQDYQEYVESFVHEIKIPIGALSLTFDNTKNYTLKKETDKIFQLVEQMLYYARSENTEKDYFVKQLQLDEVIHNVILKFRHSLMERKAIINIHDIENVIYTDEKWLTFILSQIVQNAIKYFDKQENKLTIYSQDNGTNILLVIEDNGCGIKASDLSRVFEKGFTGSNRNKANATGMGLYLSKKLCDRLGLKLDIASTEKEYTRLTITFPKGTVHNFSE